MEPTAGPALRPASGIACLALETVEGTPHLTLQALDAASMKLLDRFRVLLLSRGRDSAVVMLTTFLDSLAFVENLKGDACGT